MGNHLCEKSDTVQWIYTTFPHKRKHRLKDHSKLQELGKEDPNSTEIFEDSVIDTYYPQRPAEMEEVCLYDFVIYYAKCKDDKSGQRKYRRLTKPCLPNHRLFDPNKEDQKEEYFYSMLLLFVPFRSEGNLLAENESAEKAFSHLVEANPDMYSHHDRLQQMLKVNAKVKEINEARQEEATFSVDKEDEDKGPQIVGEATAAMNDMQELQANCTDEISLEVRIDKLNADQSHVFKRMSEHLLHQQKQCVNAHNCNHCKCLLAELEGLENLSLLKPSELRWLQYGKTSMRHFSVQWLHQQGLQPLMLVALLCIVCFSYPLSMREKKLAIGDCRETH